MSAMKELTASLEELGLEAITFGRSEIDGAVLVMIDTLEHVGRVRIDLNDGTIWDQDPEEDVPAMLDGFEIQENWLGDSTLVCLTCARTLGMSAPRPRTLRDYVAAAKHHNENCKNGGKQ